MAHETKYGQIEVPGVPADEPVFVFRARDVHALDVLKFYKGRCTDGGSPAEHLSGIQQAIDRVAGWQATHDTREPGVPSATDG